MRIFNYNKSPHESYRGVKFMKLFINGDLVGVRSFFSFIILIIIIFILQGDSIYCHKAPGVDLFDYSQFIDFTSPDTPRYSLIRPTTYPYFNNPAYPDQDYICPAHPCGSVIKIQLISTWGDLSFIGLDRIRLYSPDGKMIPVDINKVGQLTIINYHHFYSFIGICIPSFCK